MTASFNSVQLLLVQAICTLVLLCAPAEASAPRAAADGRVHTEVHTYLVAATKQDPAVWVHSTCLYRGDDDYRGGDLGFRFETSTTWTPTT